MLGVQFNPFQRLILNVTFKIIHMKITLDALQVLDAIDRHGSFTAAAAALHRVPSALSHAVAKLESDLDAVLFVRAGRRATLTTAGRALLDDGRHLLRAAGDLERRVQRIATGWEAELRIALDMIIPARHLLPLIGRFLAGDHGTQIRLSYEVLGGGWDALVTGRADLVIGAVGDMPAKGGIGTRQFAEARMAFMVAPGHPLAAWDGPLPAAELRRYRAVTIADTSRELAARTAGLPEGQETLRVPDMEAKAAAQAAGLGVGHLPRWLATREAAAGRLVERELAEPRPDMPCHVAWRTRYAGKALAWFLAELEKPEESAALAAGL